MHYNSLSFKDFDYFLFNVSGDLGLVDPALEEKLFYIENNEDLNDKTLLNNFKSTAIFRRRQFKDLKLDAKTYFLRYPAFLQKEGYTLVSNCRIFR